jgi:UDP-N-acetylmuramoyl-tripeptide--D-alanyl-D-alanine ligase
MRELGTDSANIHEQTGEEIAKLGIDALYGVEGFAKNLLEGAENKGLKNVKFYENSTIAGERFVNEVNPGDLILIKGSRGVKTEKIIEKLLEKFELEG